MALLYCPSSFVNGGSYRSMAISIVSSGCPSPGSYPLTSAAENKGPGTRDLSHRLLGDVVVGVDVLDVVVLVELVPELQHLLAILEVEVDHRGRDVAGLGALSRDAGVLEGLADGLEELRVASNLK